MHPLVLVSGPPGAGKTTVAKALAQSHERSIHMDTDVFFAAVERGFVEPYLPGAAEQNRACVTAAARSLVPYVEAGYQTFADGVVLPWALQRYIAELGPHGVQLDFVVLLPAAEAVVRRGLARNDRELTAEIYESLHGRFADAALPIRHVVDSTDLSEHETVEVVAAGLAEERFRVDDISS